ncbi:hypothetical protein [Paenibacillus aceris]|uniref:PepSY domain-containing protein n=1 Tax=Paenibacillus aceris TaxID=869555 RepID=A0ABS4I320_9BACL|nr:hypothetical protein [Paenibacillus aceris]MBP1965307.1 hypothetical protein [Paenibacillus aceris]NHW35989.1 hypothetical protein [Paenibacillus aceris]
MKLRTAWTTACFICIGSLLFLPVQSSAGDNSDRTSLVQRSGQSAADSPQTAAAKPVPDLRSESTLTATVDKWRAALAHEAGFEGWQSASWNSYPLGPGTHGWVVILTDHGEDVGYMIVHATENGTFRLTEYGTGKHPLFSLTTLYRSLVQHELIPTTISYSDFAANETIAKERLYTDALTSVWKIKLQDQTYYLDAKSGEVLPLKEDPTPKLTDTEDTLPETDLAGEAITTLHPAFDPYDRMPWIVGAPLPVNSLPELQNALDTNENLTYVTELYDGQVTLPLAILGYQSWQEGSPYLILDHEGPRYVRLSAALGMGHVYE